MADQQDYAQSKQRAASLLLSFVAGYLDSCTFLALFGLFVAQDLDYGRFVVASKCGIFPVTGSVAVLLATTKLPVTWATNRPNRARKVQLSRYPATKLRSSEAARCFDCA